MAKAAQNRDLKATFEKHEETEEQVSRLEQVFGHRLSFNPARGLYAVVPECFFFKLRIRLRGNF